jgi:hypothetical protein
VEILRQVENLDYKGLSIRQSIVKFYAQDGVRGLLKGNLPAMIRILPFSAVEFFSYEFYKNQLMRGDPKNSTFARSFLCGALAGLNSITLTFPLDVMRTRLACNTGVNSSVKDTHLFQSLVNLFKDGGIRGLYKGYSVTVLVRDFY